MKQTSLRQLEQVLCSNPTSFRRQNERSLSIAFVQWEILYAEQLRLLGSEGAVFYRICLARESGLSPSEDRMTR